MHDHVGVIDGIAKDIITMKSMIIVIQFFTKCMQDF